jgi:hypothetical protein
MASLMSDAYSRASVGHGSEFPKLKKRRLFMKGKFFVGNARNNSVYREMACELLAFVYSCSRQPTFTRKMRLSMIFKGRTPRPLLTVLIRTAA